MEVGPEMIPVAKDEKILQILFIRPRHTGYPFTLRETPTEAAPPAIARKFILNAP